MKLSRRQLLGSASAFALLSREAEAQLTTRLAGGGSGRTFDVDFVRGQLGPGAFTRATSGTYFDSSGVMRTAGLNIWLQSSNLADAANGLGGVGVPAPVVTVNNTLAPDGTMTGARVFLPAVSSGQASTVQQNKTTVTTTPYTLSVWLRGDVGGEVVFLSATPDGVTYFRSQATLTTSWQRFSLTTGNLTASTWFLIGSDRRDAAQPNTPAQTVYMWAPQIELGSFASPYAPTTTFPNSAPRFDYDPATLEARGLLIEDTSTNLVVQSGNLANAAWATGSAIVGLPVVTANQVTAPDGTLTAARIVYPAITGATAFSVVAQNIPGAFSTGSVWLRGSVGGEQLYLNINGNPTYYSTPRITLTTQWKRYSITTPSPAPSGWWFNIGADLSDTKQTSTLAQTIYAWGGQAEAQQYASSYIPTTVASVQRTQDVLLYPGAALSGFNGTAGTWFAEFVPLQLNRTNGRVIGHGTAAGDKTPIFLSTTANTVGQYDGIAPMGTANSVFPNVVAKVASSWISGQAKICANAGPVATSAALTSGYALFATNGIKIFTVDVVNGGANNASGYIRRVSYWPRILSDAEMQGVTVLGPTLDIGFLAPGVLDPRVQYSRTGPGTYFDSTGIMRTAAVDQPRWDYDPVTKVLNGLLTEAARTNVMFPSTPGTGWFTNSTTSVPNSGIAPDGTNTFMKMSNTTDDSFHGRQVIAPGVPNTVYTCSIYAKMGEIRYLQIIFDDLGGGNPAGIGTFDLLNGTVSSGATHSITSVGNGVYRCVLNGSVSGPATTQVRMGVNNSTIPNPGFYGPTYVGDPAQGTHLWGAQVEVGGTVSSLIQTTTASVTRGVDSVSVQTGAWFNQRESSLFAEFIYPRPFDAVSPHDVCGLTNQGANAAGTQMVLRARETNNTGQAFFSKINNVVARGDLVGAPSFGISKTAATWPASLTASGSFNGNAIGTVAFTAFTDTSLLNIGNHDPRGDSPLNGYVRRIVYWPRPLSNAELIALTT